MRKYAFKCPKGKVLMTLLSKRLVGIAASTVLLSLVSAAAHAQGTWYTDKALWQSIVTNATNAVYSGIDGQKAGPYVNNGVTAAVTAGSFYGTGSAMRTSQATRNITFSFSGNAFSGEFGMSTDRGALLAETTSFTIVGNVINQSFTTSKSGFKFLGYISDSASPISVRYNNASSGYASLTKFSFGNGTNPADPGSNVAPEPGSFALALTGGGALIGICIRRRRNAG
jgi:hypothetical protein